MPVKAAGMAYAFFKTAKELISSVEDVKKYLKNAPETPDPILIELRSLHATLSDFSLAAWASAREENLSFLAAHSAVALQTASAFAKSGKLLSDPEWTARIALAERDSLLAVQTFTGDAGGGFWLRPNSLKAISWAGDPNSYEKGWMPHIPDRAKVDSMGRVWDHRWALPAAIYAIAVRIAVLATRGDQFKSARSEINGYIEFIAHVFRQMESGIRSLDNLSPTQINRIATQGVPIAVADIYGGYYIGGLFDPMFNRHSFNDVPFPSDSIVPSGGNLDINLRNAAILTQYWRDHVARAIGLPELLQISGRLENLIANHPPLPQQPSSEDKLFYSGGGGSSPVGAIYRVMGNGELRWHRYEGRGETSALGAKGWHRSSGNQIGGGWNGFRHLVGSGNAIFAVQENGDLLWYSYEGSGERDPTGSLGWHPNSGNPIGSGWNSFRHLVGSGNVIFAVQENGDLLWYSYEGSGARYVTGREGWRPNSGNQIGSGWNDFSHLFSGGGDHQKGRHILHAVTKKGNLLWYRYDGRGESDISGNAGWHSRSGNIVGAGW